MPMYDFGSVDESRTDSDNYNWGYDPVNYNVPEGSYSTNPADGTVRIRELKTMIAALHRHGIGVIMDVVYNHTYTVENNCFQRCLPNYFYRTREDGSFSNASGCGNEIASEHPMVRKYILDSILYWIREYHIDGFRFDLMGVLDMETMQMICDAANRMPVSGKCISGVQLQEPKCRNECWEAQRWRQEAAWRPCQEINVSSTVSLQQDRLCVNLLY